MVELPPTLLAEVDQLVQMGMFPTRDAAVAELLRLGLEVLRERKNVFRLVKNRDDDGNIGGHLGFPNRLLPGGFPGGECAVTMFSAGYGGT